MKRHLWLAPVATILVLLGTIQYAVGAAVMSVDFGSAWMKVNSVNFSCLLWKLVANEIFYFKSIGRYRVTGCSHGHSVK